MRIRTVTIDEFGAIGRQTLRFTDGLNIIVGANGTGKSTWHAATYAALGGCPTVAGTPVDQRLRERRPRSQPAWSVSTDVVRGEREFRLTQDLLRPYGSSAVDLGTSEDVSARIAYDGGVDATLWLGLDRRSFAVTAYVEQAYGLLRSPDNTGHRALQRALAAGGGERTVGDALDRVVRYQARATGDAGDPESPLGRAVDELRRLTLKRTERQDLTRRHEAQLTEVARACRTLADAKERLDRGTLEAARAQVRDLEDQLADAKRRRDRRAADARLEEAAHHYHQACAALAVATRPVAAAADPAPADLVSADRAPADLVPTDPAPAGPFADAPFSGVLFPGARVSGDPQPAGTGPVRPGAVAGSAYPGRSRSPDRASWLVAGALFTVGVVGSVVAAAAGAWSGLLLGAAIALTGPGVVITTVLRGPRRDGAGGAPPADPIPSGGAPLYPRAARIISSTMPAPIMPPPIAPEPAPAAAPEPDATEPDATEADATEPDATEPAPPGPPAWEPAESWVSALRDEVARWRAELRSALGAAGTYVAPLDDELATLERHRRTRAVEPDAALDDGPAGSVEDLTDALHQTRQRLADIERPAPSPAVSHGTTFEIGYGDRPDPPPAESPPTPAQLTDLATAHADARSSDAAARTALIDLETRLAALAGNEAELARAQREYDRLRRLDWTLDQAATRLESARTLSYVVAARELGIHLGTWLRDVTDGRYTSVRIDPDTLTVYIGGDQDPEVDAFQDSVGTSDQVALLLRLALYVHAKADKPGPLLLDDVIAHSDPARSARTMGVLDYIARLGHQVILFTTQEVPGHPATAYLHGPRRSPSYPSTEDPSPA
jgi:hypothetical protein